MAARPMGGRCRARCRIASREVLAIDPPAHALEFERQLAHVGRARRHRGAGRRRWSAAPGGEVGILLRNRPASVGLLLGVLQAGGCVVTINPGRGRGAHPRRPRRARPAGAAPASPTTSPTLVPDGLDRDDGRPSADLGVPLTRRAGRADAGGARPAGGGGAHADQRHHRAAEADRPHLRDARAGAASAPSTTSSTHAASAQLRSGVAIVNSPLVHLGGLFRVLQCVTDGRSFALLERFTVDGWVDAVRRHRPATASLVPTALRMVLEADLDPADLSQPPLGDLRHRAARPRRRRRLLRAALRRAGAHLVRRHRVRRRRRRLEPRRPPASSGPTSGGASGGPTPAASCGSSTPTTGDALGARTTRACSRSRPRQLGADAGWVRTTDLARIDADGFLWILGRADQAIIRGGFKVHPRRRPGRARTPPRRARRRGRRPRRPTPRRGAGRRGRAAAGRGRPTPATLLAARSRRCSPATSSRPRSGSSTSCPAPTRARSTSAPSRSLFRDRPQEA